MNQDSQDTDLALMSQLPGWDRIGTDLTFEGTHGSFQKWFVMKEKDTWSGLVELDTVCAPKHWVRRLLTLCK